ncbi:MAG TPA: rhomboid family intramembrane serine protease [Phycisphaerae bacterium]|nr:rhomboid family intramembrane serine protease [Phycisphaerae bacterium]
MAWHSTWNDPPERKRGWLVDRGGFFPPGVKIVLLVTIGVYVVDVLTRGRLTQIGALSVRSLMTLQMWRLFTYMFLHSLGGIAHIGWNMFIFVMLGHTLERQLGSRQFLWLYFLSGILGGLFEVTFNVLMHMQYGSFMTRQGPMTFLDIPAVGASAGVAGVLVAFACRNPRAVFLLFFFLPIQARWLALIYCLAETRHIFVGLRYGWVDGVAHAAHFGGMVLGFVWIKWGTRIVARMPRGARRPRPGSFERNREREKAELDRILKKVHERGVDSLTLREKMFLQDVGNKYRD